MATLKNTTINDTGFITLPSGTTAQRPSSPLSGYIRYNSTFGEVEVYNGTSWYSRTAPVQNGLLAYLDAGNTNSYPGTGTTWTDLSNNGKNSTLVNGPTFSSSGGYFIFDGTNDYATLPNTTLGNGNLAWTCNAWMKTTTGTNALGQGSILSNSSGGPVYSVMGVNSGKIVYWTYQNNAWAQKLGSKTVNDDKWHMLTWVNYTNYTMDMYVDGVLDANVANSTSGNNNPIDIIGGSWAGYFPGSIAQILIYTGVSLTAAQVAQNYDAVRGRFGV